jgi:cell division protein FtsB
MGETERLTVEAITELQKKIAKQEQVNQELWAENEDLEKKLDKVRQIVNNYDGTTPSMITQFSEIQKVLEENN